MEIFPPGHQTEALFQKWINLKLLVTTDLTNLRITSGTCFEGMEVSWRAAEAWHSMAVMQGTVDSLGEFISESVAQS